MHGHPRQVRRLRPRQGLLLLFCFTILLPCILLAIFSFRAIRQERPLAAQQVRERLKLAAELRVGDLEEELRHWKRAVEQVIADGAGEVARLPDRIRRAVSESGSAAVIISYSNALRVLARDQVLYETGAFRESLPEQPLPADLRAAEAQELQHHDYPRAAMLYRQLLNSGSLPWRAAVLQRLGRTYRKQGRIEEAKAIYREMRRLETDQIGPLPAHLVAGHELCSLLFEQRAEKELPAAATEFYRSLVGGGWRLERPRYLYYSARVRSWMEGIANAPEEFHRLRSLESRKPELSEAVEHFLAMNRNASPKDLGPPQVRPLFQEEGGHLAIAEINSAKSSSLRVLPLDGASAREIGRWPDNSLGDVAWTPDGRQLLFTRTRPEQNEDLRDFWLVPVEGGEPQPLGVDARIGQGLSIHPDGRKVASHARSSEGRGEISVMENIQAQLSAQR